MSKYTKQRITVIKIVVGHRHLEEGMDRSETTFIAELADAALTDLVHRNWVLVSTVSSPSQASFNDMLSCW